MGASEGLLRGRRWCANQLARRPAAIWSYVAIELIGGAGCLLAAAAPIAPGAPRMLQTVVGVGLIVSAVGLWMADSRVRVWLLELLVFTGAALISTLIAKAVTGVGEVLTSFTYLWIVIYAAYNFSRWVNYLLLVLIASGFGAALLVNPIPRDGIVWLLSTATFWTTGVMLEWLASGLRNQAETDPLTGILNRRGFVKAAARTHELCTRSGLPPVLAVIDLDGFKVVNDRHGHEAGDRMLAEIAQCWRRHLGPSHLIARFGGDEFVVLLSGVSREGAAEILDRLKVTYPIGWSRGLAEWTPVEPLDACLRRADRDLYAMKATRISGPGSDA